VCGSNNPSQPYLVGNSSTGVQAAVTVIAVIVGVGTLLIIRSQLQEAHRAADAANTQAELQAKSQQSQVFLEITRRYQEIYRVRNELLNMNFSWQEFHRRHPTIDDKLASKEWLTLRRVAVVNEMLGVLVKHKYLDPNVLFDMFFLNPPRSLDNPEVVGLE